MHPHLPHLPHHDRWPTNRAEYSDQLVLITRQGVEIRRLTGALASTNVLLNEALREITRLRRAAVAGITANAGDPTITVSQTQQIPKKGPSTQ